MTDAKGGKKRLKFRDYVITGMTALLPLWLTFYILWFLLKLVGNLIFPVIRPILRNLLHQRPPEELLIALSAALVLILVWGFGYLIIHVFGHGQIAAIEARIAGLPFIRTIHAIIRRLVDVIFSSRGENFQSVVRVEFPVAGQYAIGFVTSQDLAGESPLVSVLVPTAPNPTSGFLLFVPREKLSYLQISIDDAMTLILSMGTVGPRQLPLAPRPD